MFESIARISGIHVDVNLPRRCRHAPLTDKHARLMRDDVITAMIRWAFKVRPQ